MTANPEYTFDALLYRHLNYEMWQAIDSSDGATVAVKCIEVSSASPLSMQSLKHEYKILQTLPEHHPDRPLGFIDDGQHCGIVFPFRAGIPFEHHLPSGSIMQLDDFFPVALELTDLLRHLHANHIIHRDIRPQNIIIDPATGSVRLDGFGCAERIDTRLQAVPSSNEMIGSMRYMAPEQTGRIHAPMDYRTDFYALGATFHEWLAGKVPFDEDDAMSVIFSHLARRPEDPSRLNPDIPPMLSNIILKLLEKNPDHRYQSCHGLKHDLMVSAGAHAAGIAIDVPLGGEDVSNRFSVPELFLNRNDELSRLLDLFESTRKNSSKLVLISGYSGVGKTSLVNQLFNTLQKDTPFLIRGKFGHLQQDIAYSAIIKAFEHLTRQLLSADEAEFSVWQEKINRAVSPFGRLIVDIIPQMEAILGNPPPPEPVDAAQAQTRLALVFSRFINVFAKPEHPLVLFMDDLQWADSASLKLLEYITTGSPGSALLTVAAFRDNEVHPSHPFSLALERIMELKAVQRIELKPLPESTTRRIVAETLHHPARKVGDIAAIVHSKTAGNPFFTAELLKMLFWEGSIRFDEDQGSWEWDSHAIHEKEITDDVAAFMAERLKALPSSTRKILHLASFLGNTFDPVILCTGFDIPAGEITHSLLPALAQGLIIPMAGADSITEWRLENRDPPTPEGGCYRFHHDRIQEAAYGLEPEEHRQAIHMTVARTLAKRRKETDGTGLLSEIVRHYRQALAAVTDDKERLDVAQLHLEAARQAMNTNSFEKARDFSETALSLFPESVWNDQYDDAWQAHAIAMESAFLQVDIEHAEELFNILLKQSRTPEEYLVVIRMAMRRYATLTRFDRVIDVGIQGLNRAGIRYRRKPGLPTIAALLIRYRFLLRMTPAKKKKLAAMVSRTMPLQEEILCDIIGEISYAAYCVRELMFIMYTEVRTAAYFMGRRQLIPALFSYLCTWCCGGAQVFSKDFRTAGNWLALSEEVLGRPQSMSDLSYELFIYGYYMVPFQAPWPTARACFKRAAEMMEHSGVDIGGINSMGAMFEGHFNFETTENLILEMENNIRFVRRFGSVDTLMSVQAILVFVKHLAGQTVGVDDDLPDWETIISRSRETESYAAGYAYLRRGIFYYLTNAPGRALESIQQAKPYLLMLGTTFFEVEALLYMFLSASALYPSATPIRAFKLKRVMRSAFRKISLWASYHPGNFLHLKRFMQAENARNAGKPEKALTFYRQASKMALDNGFTLYASHIEEQAGKTLLSLSRENDAEHHLEKALEGYENLGWTIKVEQLRKRRALHSNNKTAVRLSSPVDSTFCH